MGDRKLNITVNIGDRPYRLKIEAEEEELVREAAKVINKKLKEFQHSFVSKDKQDFLAMIALQNTVDGMKHGELETIEYDILNEKIGQLEELLASV